MTEAHVGIEDKSGLKIPGTAVTIIDRFTGMRVGSATADSDGVADISWLGTPFGTYRADAVTPKGWKGSIDFQLDFLGNPGTLVIRMQESDEGEYGASAAAWFQNLDTTKWLIIGGVALGGILLLSYFLRPAGQSGQPIVVVGGK